MKKTLLVIAALILSSSMLMAGEPGKKGGRGRGHFGQMQVENAFRLPKSITLTSEQQTKLDGLKAEFTPKLTAAKAKVDAIMTPERQATAKKAREDAKAAGKKGREAFGAGLAAVNLSDTEKVSLKTAHQEQEQLVKQVREQIRGFLTDDQRAQLKERFGKRGGKAKKAAATET